MYTIVMGEIEKLEARLDDLEEEVFSSVPPQQHRLEVHGERLLYVANQVAEQIKLSIAGARDRDELARHVMPLVDELQELISVIKSGYKRS